MSGRILHVTAEVAPYSRTGGLGDVLGALPAAQRRRGLDARVLSPLYGFTKRTDLSPQRTLNVSLGGTDYPVTLWQSEDGVYLFADVPGLLDRPDPYGPNGEPYADNPRRFAVLCKVAAALADETDLYHLHDWQAGLTALYLRARRPSIQSVHNLAYQGLCDFDWATELEVPPALRSFEGLEYYGQMSLLKAGLVLADRLATVSPTYARELQREPGGRGLAGLFRFRKTGLIGILNGLDHDRWDPRTDAMIVANYGPDDLAGKASCRAELRRRMGLDEGPIFGLVSRAARQKGLDLVVAAAPELIERGARFVAVADGSPRIVTELRHLAARFPNAFGLREGFNDKWARRIYAGADFVLIPSRFEPCGLTQQIAMRYGTVPVVRRTGGLADTVVDAQTGICFDAPTPEALIDAVDRALTLHADRSAYQAVQGRGMARDGSWDRAAAEYEDLYAPLLGRPM